MEHFRGGSHPGTSRFARGFACVAIVSAVLLFLFFIAGGARPAHAQVAGDSLYAVLFNGSSKGSDQTYLNDLEFIFRTLINDYGYTKDNIMVLSYSGTYYDLDGDNVDDVDFPGTREDADTVFARLKRVVTDGDVVFFYATDHGSTLYGNCNTAALEVYEGNRIFDQNIAAYFDSLDTPDREIIKIFTFGECYSGGMIPELSALDYPVMIATATKACDEKSNAWDDPGCPDTLVSCDHCAYLFHWTAALHGSTPDGSSATYADINNDGYVSIKEASRFAVMNDEFAQVNSSPKETPQYWDTDCIVGQKMTLDGKLSSLPGMIAFFHQCHAPFPCRWGSWRSCGGTGPFPSESYGDSNDRRTVEATVWTDPQPAPGETTYVYARVRNGGDTPLTSAEVNFYYSDPGFSLIYPQTGLSWFATETVPFLPPHAILTVGPVAFVAPPEGNCFGEAYWTLMATAEHFDSPVESGWLAEDDHVAAANRFELRGVPGETKTIHLVARNPLPVPVKALLSVDKENLPVGWSASMNPASGDTIELDPDSWTPVELVLTGASGPIHEGFVDIAMALNTTTVKECESCDDSICGGYIGEAGGCSVKLVVEGTVGVAAPKLTVASTAAAITLSWESNSIEAKAGFNVYRSEKETGNYLRLNDALIIGSGQLCYVDKTAMPGKIYLYVVGVVDGGSETLCAPVEASLEPTLEFGLSQNYPNPFNPSTTIRVGVSEDGPISVRIYDTAGHLVRTLFAGTKTRGVHYLYWNGESDKGEFVSSGVYYCRIESPKEGTQTKKLVVIR